jgi:hypothetical protein
MLPDEVRPYPAGATPRQMTVSWVYFIAFMLFFSGLEEIRWLRPVAALIVPGISVAMTVAYLGYAFRVLSWSFSDRWQPRMAVQQAFHLLFGVAIAWLTDQRLKELSSALNPTLLWAVAAVESSILVPFLLRFLVYSNETRQGGPARR